MLQFLNAYASTILLIGLIGLGYRFYRLWKIRPYKPRVVGEIAEPANPPWKQPPTAPLVSLLVAAWNEEPFIDNFIGSFERLDYSNKELILIAGGSDNTFAKAMAWAGPHIIVLEQVPGEGKYHALQRGLSAARGSIVYLTDADCLLTTHVFRQVITPIIAGSESAVTGRFQPLAYQLNHPFILAQWHKREYEFTHENPSVYTASMVGANSAIIYPLLKECWAAWPNQSIGEDHYLGLAVRKAGYKIYEARESYIETRFAESMGAYIQQQSRFQRSWLTLNYRFNDPQWRGNGLTLLKAQAMVVTSLLLLSLGPIVGVLWLLGWAYFFIPYLQVKLWSIQSANMDRVSLFALGQLMVADFFVRAVVLPQLLSAKWRSSW